MKAILVGQNRELTWSDVPTPVIRDDEVLVEISYAALNRADLMQRAGNYPPPPGAPEWMGLEISGHIVKMGAVAAKESPWKIGDAVCALLGGGGYAEYAAVRYDMLMPVPKGRSLAEAAAMPEAYATAYLNLFIEGKVKAGDTLLVHAAKSGLASVVIPMAKVFGLRVITTVRSDAAAESVKPLGADVVVNTAKTPITEVLKAEAEAGHGVDMALDCLGGKMMGECLPYLNYGARWVMIATLAGDVTEVNLKTVYVKNIRIIGSTLRSRKPEIKAQILHDLVRDVWPKVEAGLIPPSIWRILPITEAEEAHAILERSENVGKVVLQVR